MCWFIFLLFLGLGAYGAFGLRSLSQLFFASVFFFCTTCVCICLYLFFWFFFLRKFAHFSCLLVIFVPKKTKTNTACHRENQIYSLSECNTNQCNLHILNEYSITWCPDSAIAIKDYNTVINITETIDNTSVIIPDYIQAITIDDSDKLSVSCFVSYDGNCNDIMYEHGYWLWFILSDFVPILCVIFLLIRKPGLLKTR